MSRQAQARNKPASRRSAVVDTRNIKIVSNLKPGDDQVDLAELVVKFFGRQIREALVQRHLKKKQAKK